MLEPSSSTAINPLSAFRTIAFNPVSSSIQLGVSLLSPKESKSSIKSPHLHQSASGKTLVNNFLIEDESKSQTLGVSMITIKNSYSKERNLRPRP
jgi:hypothetical protein